MKRQSPEEMRDMLFQGTAQHNLSLIINFHNELRAGLKARVTEIDQALKTMAPSQERNALLHYKVIAEEFDDMLRRTTFFLMYAHAEEWFFLVSKIYAPSGQPESRGGSIQRFKPVLQRLGIDLSQDRNWQFLCDAEKIRDCLLHANGRASFMNKKNSQEIHRIIHRRKNMLEIANDRLRIGGQFLNHFREAVDAVMAVTNARVPSTPQ